MQAFECLFIYKPIVTTRESLSLVTASGLVYSDDKISEDLLSSTVAISVITIHMLLTIVEKYCNSECTCIMMRCPR